MRVPLKLCTVFCMLLASNLLFSQNFQNCATAFPVCEMRTSYFIEMAAKCKLHIHEVIQCSKGCMEPNSILQNSYLEAKEPEEYCLMIKTLTQ